MKRLLNPATNPAGWSAALALAYAVAQAVLNVHAQHKALTAPVVVAIAGSVLAGWIRNRVTPVADPKDGSGNPLLTANAHAAENFARAIARDPHPHVLADPPSAFAGLSDPERRRAEDMRLMFAPGTPSFYPYPDEQEAPSPSGTGRPLDVTATYATGVTNPKPPAVPLRNSGGYTGGKPASEMPPPPTDVPSVSLLPPAVQPPSATTAGPAT